MIFKGGGFDLSPTTATGLKRRQGQAGVRCLYCDRWKRLRVLHMTLARNKSCCGESILMTAAAYLRKSKTPPSHGPRGWGTQTSRPNFRIQLQDLASKSNFKTTRRNHAGADETTDLNSLLEISLTGTIAALQNLHDIARASSFYLFSLNSRGRAFS